MKVLLVSHTCFSTYNNMGKTFLTLFSSFRKEELCQLYIYPSLPDVDVCESYYRVTDKEMLKSLCSFAKPGGVLEFSVPESGKTAEWDDPSDAAIYRNKRNSTPVIRLLRDAMWKIGCWYTPALRRWVEEQKPDCVFLAPGYAGFIYDIAIRISRDYHLPIAVYICDDYYFVRKPDNLIGRWQLVRLRKKTDLLMHQAKRLVTISEEMKTAYSGYFKIPTDVVMTGAERECLKETVHNESSRVIAYFGNLARNRVDSVAEIGRLLDRLNEEKGLLCELRLYTPELDEQMRRGMENIQSVRLMKFVQGAALAQAMGEADVLLHTEAFDAENADLVKYSVSTKIADSLASGIPLLAYGPENVASMAHLIRNDCAIVATSKEDLPEALKTALFDGDRRRTVSENAMQTAKKYHQKEQNSRKLRQILELVQENHCHE